MTASKKYINRDLSWIEFNRRVLEEAEDVATPLLERMQFLSIVSSNLDEFMSVRVAGLKDQLKAGFLKADFTGYTPHGLLKRIMKRTSQMVRRQYKVYRELMRSLAKEGTTLLSWGDLNREQAEAMSEYFQKIVYPVLTPMAVDSSRPFPLLHGKELYLAVVLKADPADEKLKGQTFSAIVQVPSILSRAVEVPGRRNSRKMTFLLLEDLIKVHIGQLFSGYEIEGVHAFRVTRNSDLAINEEGAEDLLQEIEKELRRRRRGFPVRLEVETGMHGDALELLKDELEVTEDDIFEIEGSLDLTFLSKFASSLPNSEHLRYPPLDPVYPVEFEETEQMMSVIRERDVLVYHPYESFEAVNDFIYEAAVDPDVLAIKMTLYRVNVNSLLVKALAQAAESGKQVTVVVELKARFDEERNIAWARQLEKAGCHVVYGLVGLKTHAKITLVVRREEGSLRRYVHVGTGNYNENTAKVYTDAGLFTCHPDIGTDASALFNEMTGYSTPHDWRAFAVAPAGLKPKLFDLIDREIEFAKAGKPARIVAKLNSLSNQSMIDKLYEASQAGVSIHLIVRGVCCLRPGVPGLSENVRVISIVDRFLEHSRILAVSGGGEEEVYISSADWMTRNLSRRVELLCPVYDPSIRQMLLNLLQMNLLDNVKARELEPSGNYSRVAGAEQPLRSQFGAADIPLWKTVAIASMEQL
ncbi:polyphosphate kinase 1 [Cohnella thailandensis]|uniref:Polyphosphate kinase n=1 Tax=Cohnella thailandensis TaxID=557557 RepID=A0A841T222_9BACL|nr:polyphosphate kinase 1 [Cohnella thailandensis]MBB6635927.1 polyphosphate kinase 1 [Cohnella thailandensis]MBP1976305.1 polyphosphate kinase [Cohnella thailandensis]